MTDDRLSTTMRIEIPPEVRQEMQQGKKPGVMPKRRVVRRYADRSKSDSGPIGASRYATLSDPNFQQLFQSVYDAAVITNPRGDILDANPRAEEFFSCKREKFGQHSVLDLISGADESLIDTLRKNLESDRFTLIQAHCRRLDGSLFPSEISVNRLQLTGKDYLCFFVRDVTLRRQTEEMVRTVHNAILNAGNGIAITDLTGTLEYVNPATVRLWRFAVESDLIKRKVQDLWVDPQIFAGMMKQVTMRGSSWAGELMARCNDGDELPIQVSAAANHDSEDQLVGVVFSFTDISDRKRAEGMARETEQQRIMLESVGTACHHLGQPATVLLASLGMMQKRETLIDDEMRGLLHQGINSAEQLQIILHRLHTINEYRPVQYLDSEAEQATSDGNYILEL